MPTTTSRYRRDHVAYLKRRARAFGADEFDRPIKIHHEGLFSEVTTLYYDDGITLIRLVEPSGKTQLVPIGDLSDSSVEQLHRCLTNLYPMT